MFYSLKLIHWYFPWFQIWHIAFLGGSFCCCFVWFIFGFVLLLLLPSKYCKWDNNAKIFQKANIRFEQRNHGVRSLCFLIAFLSFCAFVGPGQGVRGFRNAAKPGAPQVCQERI